MAAISCCAAMPWTARARCASSTSRRPRRSARRPTGWPAPTTRRSRTPSSGSGFTSCSRSTCRWISVAELFGGVIPTDIQGLYRSGAPAVATAVDAPYYHTAEDTPDKVDLARLEQTVVAFDRALDQWMAVPAERFAVPDPALWRAEAQVSHHEGEVQVAVQLRDSAGQLQSHATVEAVLFEDDFFAIASARGLTDGDGGVTLRLPGGAPATPESRRFLHVSAGPRWPLVEMVRPL